MTRADLAGWQEYYSLFPFGRIRDDYRLGLISYLIALSNTSKKRSKPKFAFPYIFESPALRRHNLMKDQPEDEMKRVLMGMGARLRNSKVRMKGTRA